MLEESRHSRPRARGFPPPRLVIAAALVVIAWVVPFLAHLFGIDVLTRVPLWALLTVLLAAAALLLTVRGRTRPRLGLALAILVVTVSVVALRSTSQNRDERERAWRRSSSQHLASTLLAVGEEVARLEALSSSIGARVAARIRDRHGTGDDLPERFAVFEMLDSLASDLPSSRALPPGTEIGIQVFDGSGERTAWAGWPQSTSELDHVFIDSGAELIYSRKVSLYSILTHLIPVEDDGRRVATVMVDMPLEVNFRVNNRFLKSTSLAENIAYGSVASLTFEYFPTPASLPNRIARYKREQDANWKRRQRRIADARPRLERARSDRGQGEDAGAHGLGIEDSVLTYFAFPRHVEPISEVSGDEITGLSGRVLIRTPQGNPVLRVTAAGHPFQHYAAERDARTMLLARVFLLLTLLLMFAFTQAATRGESLARRVARAGLFVGFLVVLRYALLPLYTISPSAGTKILDPTVFATPLLGGIMRSAGDLMLTSVFFVIALYGVLKIVRGREPEADLSYGGEREKTTVRVWHVAVMGTFTAAVLYAVFELTRRFTTTVVSNSNPRLLGETMRVTDLEVNALHVSTFLMLTGIILAGILVVWSMFRLTRGRGMTRSALVALTIVVAVSASVGRWEPALISALLLVFVVFAPRFVRREDLVSIVIASFCLVIVSSSVAYIFLTRNYDSLRKSFVIEKSDELLNPADDWKVVILEDVLGEYAARPEIRRATLNPRGQDVQRLAFDLWADSPLSLLGYSCAINIINAQDEVVSEFAVDMPYRVRITEGSERIDSPGDNEWVVLALTRNTPQGIVRFYRGILNLHEMRADELGGTSRHLIGKAVVDLPFFFESLEWAARTGPRTPELLRNVQEGGVAPRVEEPEALLLARLYGRQVHESSSESVPLGLRIPEDTFERALDRRWPLLESGDRSFRFIVRATDTPGEHLLAGFTVPSPLRHVLRWSTLFSLYLLYTLVVLVAILVLSSIPYLKDLLPTLTPGRKLGFQQKLLASFLVVALVPAIILGLFSVNFIKDRFVEESRKEALYKAFSARKAFVNLLHGELQFFLSEGQNMDELFAPDVEPVRSVGNKRTVRLLRDAADEATGDSLAVRVAGVVDEVSPDDLFLHREDDARYVGVVSAPMQVTGEDWSGTFYLYYARAVDSDLLGEVAEQVSADVNVYDGGELVASSREGLLAGGFISAIMNADAYLEVSVLGSDHSLATERAGQYSYQVAYLPVAGWANRAVSNAGEADPGAVDSAAVGFGGTAVEHAAMSVPLLFRPESYYAEVQKATSIVLGIFALLFAATIGLGLVLARGIFEPLRALLAGTRRIRDGDLSVRLPLRRRDEIGTVMTAFNEMTERVAASRRTLEERRRYLEIILESIGTGVISTDAEDRVLTVNAAAERIIGVTEADTLGRTAAELVGSGVAPEIFALLGAASRMERSFVADEVELAGEQGKSTIKYMLTRLQVEDRYLGTVFVFEDLTELIQSKKLSAWVEMARQIAHEIKNPLTPIRISTQFMQRAYEQRPEQFERAFREGTETILHQVDVLKRIAGEFSSYGRMQQLEIGAHPLEPLVSNIIAPYENNTAGVSIAYENGAPDATVLIDPEAVRKICSNLIENALDAMPNGGELRVTCDEHSHNGRHYVRLAFRDTGPGLSAEAAEKLFEPYFSTKTTGTGLGLAICRQLSHAMGGDVTVRSVPGGPGVEAAVTMLVQE